MIFGYDCDDIFAYSTVKFVKIRDKRLGMLRVLFQLGIIVYLIVLVIVRDGGYCATEKPQGTVQFTLRQPTVNCTIQERRTPGTHCVEGCAKRGAFASLTTPQHCFDWDTNVTELGYCDQYLGDEPEPTQYPCEHEEAPHVAHKWEPSFFVSTIVTTIRKVKVCSGRTEAIYRDGQCEDVYLPQDSMAYPPQVWNHFKQMNPWAEEVQSPDVFFVADAERYRVMIDHTMHAVQLGIGNTLSGMSGRLYIGQSTRGDSVCSREPRARKYNSGDERPSESPCYIEPTRSQLVAGGQPDYLDVFELGELLIADDVRVDDVNTVSGEGNETQYHTYRQTGATVVLTIEYINRVPWFPPEGSNVDFVYKSQVLRGTSYRMVDSKPIAFDFENGRHEKLLSVHQGIRVVAVQSGMIWKFDIQVLLLQATTSLALIAVAVTVVDALAMYILPNRVLYRAYKYQVTEDFSEIRDGKVAVTVDAIQSGMVQELEPQDGDLPVAMPIALEPKRAEAVSATPGEGSEDNSPEVSRQDQPHPDSHTERPNYVPSKQFQYSGAPHHTDQSLRTVKVEPCKDHILGLPKPRPLVKMGPKDA